MAGMRKNDRYIHALNFSLYVGGPDVIGAQNLGALCIWGRVARKVVCAGQLLTLG